MAALFMPPNILHRFNAVGRTQIQIQDAEQWNGRGVRVCHSKLEAGVETLLSVWPLDLLLVFQNGTLEEERARFLQMSSCTGTKSVHF